ncbi:EAL domain-containing protein [Franconibacter helveticus]|uniref:sensor domain-containing phosphodiesterase n=1 Tax=Franconibacter helveticus TaxID=357240 RepID=UPI000DA1D71A|nr:EAL domain-containing protein [Franconibacter helveticus]
MKYYNPLRKSGIAFLLCFLLIPLCRALSPQTIIDGTTNYLAYLPLSFAIALVFIYGRYALLPLFTCFYFWYSHQLSLNVLQNLTLVSCIIVSLIAGGLVCRYLLGRRWRYALPGKGVGVRLLGFGFITPCILKCLMLVAGLYLGYPGVVAAYFGKSSLFYSVVDFQSLFMASLSFTVLFYYPLRIILSKVVARNFWRRCAMPAFSPEKIAFTLCWLFSVVILTLLFCVPYKAVFISGYMVPVIFIFFTVGVFHLGPRLVTLTWALTALCLLSWNSGFIPEENASFMLCFVLSVFIAFTVSMIFMTVIFQRNAWMQRRYRTLAQTDPLTQLPNLRALELHLQQEETGTLCCLHMANLEILSRHYGLQMRIHCKKTVVQILQPWLGAKDKIFYLPGCDLLLFLAGPEPASRLRHIVDVLNSKRIHWHNATLELAYGAAWGKVENDKERLYRLIGQLSYLAEQTQMSEPVLALDEREGNVSGYITGQVLMLQNVKRALDEDQIMLYAQPIVDANGEGYQEILSRLYCDGQIITPDKFLPVIAQFNLSACFDMLVLQKLLRYLSQHPASRNEARFSLNLMPMTLMQKGIAREIVSLFNQYQVSLSTVIIEITEAQAFSDSETSMQNVALLRQSGLRIAIDDFGTGYANYERLKTIEADIIKIDGCFIKEITSDPVDEKIVKSICELAKVKSLTVVAEYVETQAQREMLLSLGVDYLQGYLSGRPEPLQR